MNHEELLARIELSTRRQARYARWICILSGAAALCCLAILAVVLSVMPQVRGLLPRLDALTLQMETVMSDMEAVSGQLADANLGQMAGNVDALVTASQSGVEQAIGKLNAIDIETLNHAIADLAAIVRPLAEFFGIFD